MLLFLAMLFVSAPAYAQLNCSDQDGVRVCPVAPNAFGALNIAIAGDTTATGERVDENTVYELERDGVYLLNGSVENVGYHLYLRAAAGEGHPPILQPGVDETGSSSEAFAVRGDLTLLGLYVANVDDLGGLNANMFRVQSDSARVVIDNCFLEYTRTSLFRLDSERIKLYLTNSVARNLTNISNMGNGRFIDTRGNTPDSIFVENNTFYTFSGAGLRHGGGVIPFLHFNHNTIYNGGNQLLRAERVIKARITNNMLVNPTTNAAEVADSSLKRPVIVLDSLAVPGLTELDRDILIANNNFVYTSTWTDYYSSVDSLETAPLLNDNALGFVDSNPNITVENTIEEDVAFVNAPVSDNFLAATILRIQGLEGEGNTPDYRADSDMNGTFDALGSPILGLTNPPRDFDFSYPNTATSYTAADGGFPLGDLNWFPAEKIAWLEWRASTGTSIEEEVGQAIPGFFKLEGNFPNPFNPVTNIQINLNRAAAVSVEVYDLLGRSLKVIPASTLQAGPASIRVEANDLPSGMLLYRVRAAALVGTDVQVSAGTMLLLK